MLRRSVRTPLCGLQLLLALLLLEGGTLGEEEEEGLPQFFLCVA